jgi:UDP-N-acetylglucosamine 3-dehydrogenase
LRKLKVAVVGAGSWGQNHIRVFSELEEVDLLAICDLDYSRACDTAKKYGIQPYSSLKEMMNEIDINAITICTPTMTHYQIALTAIKHNKHIFIEKPMVSTSKEAKKLLEEVDKKNVHLMVGFIERFNPGVQKVKTLLERATFGEVVLVFARRVGRWPVRIGDVGVVKDTAIHDLDIVRYVFEQDPQSIYAQMGSLGHRFEDYAQIMLGFDGIQTAFIEANWLTPRKIRFLTVTCENAQITLNYLTQKVLIEDVYGSRDVSPRWEEPLKLELKNYVNCVIEGHEPAITGIDGLKALTLAELAIKSAHENNVILLPHDLLESSNG